MISYTCFNYDQKVGIMQIKLLYEKNSLMDNGII